MLDKENGVSPQVAIRQPDELLLRQTERAKRVAVVISQARVFFKARRSTVYYVVASICLLGSICSFPRFWGAVAVNTLKLWEDAKGASIFTTVCLALLPFLLRCYDYIMEGNTVIIQKPGMRLLWEKSQKYFGPIKKTALLTAVVVGTAQIFYVIPKMYCDMRGRAETLEKSKQVDPVKAEGLTIAKAMESDLKRGVQPATIETRYYRPLEEVMPKLLSGDTPAHRELSKAYEMIGRDYASLTNLAARIRAVCLMN